MNKIEKFMTKNYCYTNPTTLKAKGIMLHSIGVNQPKAMVIINQWDNSKRDSKGKLLTESSIHGIIDANTGDYYHTMPYDYKCWHGYKGPNGSANDMYIGIEMCEPDCIKYKPNSATFTVSAADKSRAQEMVKRTYYSAVQVFADICKQMHFDPLAPGVIVSHKEGHANGVASNHADPEHLWTQLDLPFTMDGFRQDVAKTMKGVSVEESKTPEPAVKEDPAPLMEPYRVRVSTNVLRIRTAPDVNSKQVGFTGVGVFTIVDEMDGSGASKWGLLKSYEKNRNGWISLDHAKKID